MIADAIAAVLSRSMVCQRIALAKTTIEYLSGKPNRSPEEQRAYSAALTAVTDAMSIDDAVPEYPIEKAPLSVRAINVLEGAGFATIDQLLVITPKAFDKLRTVAHCNELVVAEVAEFVHQQTGRILM